MAELPQTRGYQVGKAYGGKEGISKLDEEGFGVPFVGMIMPELDGTGFIKYAKTKFPGADFPIVALSAGTIEKMDLLYPNESSENQDHRISSSH